MNEKLSWPIFWALVGVFIVIVCFFFIEPFMDLLAGSELFLTPFIVFFLLGIALIVLTLREKVTGMLKKFLLLTGASAAGLLVFAVLHNAFYALGIASSHITVLSSLAEFLHVAFFIMAIPVCLIGFVVGAAGSIVLTIKRRRLAEKLASSPQ
jgi:hypothetical protein